MTELEQKLRAAMHAAVDDEQPPRDLTARVVRRRRRRTTVMASLSAAATVAVVIAVLLAILPVHGRAPVSRSPLEPDHPTSELYGTAMPPGSDVRLLLDGHYRLAWYSTATRRIVPIAGLPQAVNGFSLMRARGGYGGVQNYFTAPLHCCIRYQVYYIADGASVATRVGTSSFPAPSSSGTFWLTTYPLHGRSGLPRAQLTGLDGQPAGRAVTLPADDSVIVAGVGRYLLLTVMYAAPGTPEQLWDPASRRVVRTFGHVDAVSPEQLAWGRSCAGCPLHVFDARTGVTTTIAIPRGSRVFAGGNVAFSPDGTLLAVELSTDGHGTVHPGRLAVIDLATGRLLTVPGVDLRPKAAEYLNFDWQSGTRRLVLILPAGRGNTFQVGYWRPGAVRLRLTTVRLPIVLNGILVR